MRQTGILDICMVTGQVEGKLNWNLSNSAEKLTAWHPACAEVLVYIYKQKPKNPDQSLQVDGCFSFFSIFLGFFFRPLLLSPTFTHPTLLLAVTVFPWWDTIEKEDPFLELTIYTLPKATLKFCTYLSIFINFKHRYNENKERARKIIIKLRGKIRTLKHSVNFTEEFILYIYIYIYEKTVVKFWDCFYGILTHGGYLMPNLVIYDL